MSQLLRDKLDAAIIALSKFSDELDGLETEQREAVLSLSWPHVPSFGGLVSHMIQWADRLGETEPARERTPNELSLDSLAALERKLRQDIEWLTHPNGAPSDIAEQIEAQLAKVLQHLEQTKSELEVLRWLHPTLAGVRIACESPQLRRTSLTQVLSGMPAPRGLSGRVRFDLPAYLEVRAAPGALETVLYHLIHNAATYARGADIHIQARVCEGVDRPSPLEPISFSVPFVLISVADQGLGIPEDRRATLFEQRMTGHGRARRLSRGLWLCRRILQAHDGAIWLERSVVGTSISSAWPSRPRLTSPSDSWPEDPIRFGQALRFTREEAELTRAVLGQMADVADSSIRNIETGRHIPTRTVRKRIIAALEHHRQTPGPAAGFFTEPGAIAPDTDKPRNPK